MSDGGKQPRRDKKIKIREWVTMQLPLIDRTIAAAVAAAAVAAAEPRMLVVVGTLVGRIATSVVVVVVASVLLLLVQQIGCGSWKGAADVDDWYVVGR